MKEYKLSVIIPVYNTEKYLKQCIDSLLQQTLDQIEIILIDDGSIDKSGEICDEYASIYSSIKVIHQKNAGQSAARNIGIQKALGKYLMFVDSDDYIIKDACSTLYNKAEKNDVDIVWADMLNDVNFKKRLAVCQEKIFTCQEYLKICILEGIYDIVPWLKIIRREFFIANNLFFYEGCFYEDQESTLRLLLTKGKLLKIAYPFYYYRENLNSTTHKPSLKKGMDCIKIIHAMDELVKNKQLTSGTEEYANNIVGMSVYHMSMVYGKMEYKDQKILLKNMDKIIKFYSKKTKLLSRRMRIQTKLFVNFPKTFAVTYKIVEKLRK